jgi:hypothetical protein
VLVIVGTIRPPKLAVVGKSRAGAGASGAVGGMSLTRRKVEKAQHLPSKMHTRAGGRSRARRARRRALFRLNARLASSSSAVRALR